MKRMIISVAVLLALLFILSAALLINDGLYDRAKLSDTAVVFGAGVQPDGWPSARLRALLNKAVELHRDGVFPRIIVLAGAPRGDVDPGQVMADYLIQRDIMGRDIYLEDAGASTYDAARNVAWLMEQQGWESVVVISNYFHVSRARLALKRFGVTTIGSAHAEFFELWDVGSVAKEVFAYGAYLFRSYD